MMRVRQACLQRFCLPATRACRVRCGRPGHDDDDDDDDARPPAAQGGQVHWLQAQVLPGVLLGLAQSAGEPAGWDRRPALIDRRRTAAAALVAALLPWLANLQLSPTDR
jgi:hypothetical protein